MTKYKTKLETMQRRADFDLVMHQGDRSRGKLITVLALVGEVESLRGRVGITVSKKVGNAVQRNLVRRRIKSIIHGYCLRTDCLVVIIARPEARLATFVDLSQEMKYCFSRLNLGVRY